MRGEAQASSSERHPYARFPGEDQRPELRKGPAFTWRYFLPLANRRVHVAHRTAVPGRTLGEVHRARHLSVLDQNSKLIRVALIPIARCASCRYPALSIREAGREARAEVLLIGILLVGECVQARTIRVDPVEIGGTLLTLRQATEEHQLAVGVELRVILAVRLPWCGPACVLWRARRVEGLHEHRMIEVFLSPSWGSR